MEETVNKKFKHFKHSPFSLEVDGVKAEVSETGKIVITQDQPDGSYDEVKTSARFIGKLYKMLMVNRTVRWSDEPYRE